MPTMKPRHTRAMEPPNDFVPEVSVIMPAKDAAGTIGAQLRALAGQQTDHEWELVVVTTRTDEATRRILEKDKALVPRLRVIETSGTGAGHARNEGAAAARGRLLLFCDADDVVTPGWIDALATGLGTHDAVGGPLEEESLNAKDSRLLRHPMVTDHLHRVLGAFPRAVTANCGIRADVFRDLDGFDTSYRASEDTEFFIRLQVRGYTLGFVPDAVVHYRHGDDLRQSLKKIYAWSTTRPRLYREYRAHGARRPRGRARRWAGLVVTSWYLVAGRERRLRWLATAVRSYGRLVGSIRHRTLYL